VFLQEKPFYFPWGINFEKRLFSAAPGRGGFSGLEIRKSGCIFPRNRVKWRKAYGKRPVFLLAFGFSTVLFPAERVPKSRKCAPCAQE
jgi:hypothetical protein